VKNREIAGILYEMAELLELKGENRFKIIAYSKAARAIESMKEDIEDVWRQGELKAIPGVGKAIADKVREYLETGQIQSYQSLVEETPPGLTELLQVQGMGPKTVALLHDKLGVTNIDELEQAALQHRIRRLPRMGATREANILKSIERHRRRSTRIPLYVAQPIVDRIVDYLSHIPGLEHITVAGSFRRGRETVGDVDILATSSSPESVISAFVQMPYVEEVLGKGPTKASVIVKETVQVDLRIVDHRSYGTVIQYFTGSKEHNVKLRGLALQRGYSLSEYSLKRLATGEELYFDREEDVYAQLGLPYISPELREDRGEIEAALAGKLPRLVDLQDIKGDLHVHSAWSDGRGSLEELGRAALSLGYQYLGLCDHSPSVGIAGGLSEERLLEKIAAVEKFNRDQEGFRMLAGTEVDIKADGSLDYPDRVLEKCDLVVASIHMAQNQTEREINGRLINAIENEHVDIIAHPTGRLIGRRDPYEVDLQVVLEAARGAGTIMEINAHPNRLDLNDHWSRVAKDMGVPVAINTDSHAPDQLKLMRYGIKVARRGWLEAKDVVNTRPLQEFMSLLDC